MLANYYTSAKHFVRNTVKKLDKYYENEICSLSWEGLVLDLFFSLAHKNRHRYSLSLERTIFHVNKLS